ncbi:MAG: cytochrome c-type biogenesis protein [Cypionkella sp.]
MRGALRWLFFALSLALLATPALAVRPDEMLPDKAQEARARDLSQGLRCLVCRNESIDDSDADLAHDLRVLLRDRITAGDTDQQAVAYIVARYGEFVLLKPTTSGANLILWLAGPVALLGGAILAYVALRRRSGAPEAPGLSSEDQARLADLLKDQI